MIFVVETDEGSEVEAEQDDSGCTQQPRIRASERSQEDRAPGVPGCEGCGLLQATGLEESSRCALILGSGEGREASSQPLSTLTLKREKTKGKRGLAP